MIMTKQFKDLIIGQVFVFSGIEYVKTEPERVSCCKQYNAAQVGNSSQKTQISPLVEVETND